MTFAAQLMRGPKRRCTVLCALGLCLALPGALTAAADKEGGVSARTERRTAPPLPQKEVDFNHPPRDCETNRLGSWTVLVEKQLAVEAPDLTRRALERLGRKLDEALAVLPEPAHADLKKLPLFLLYGMASTNGGRNNGLEYFQRTAPQHFKNLDPRMGSSIVIYDADNYVRISEFWALKALVHELAHAHHLEHWPEVQPDIFDTWECANQAGLYRNVQDENGRPAAKGYAVQNHLEYFAELSAMYFVGCNYAPTNRAALKTYDPAGYGLVRKMWGIQD